MRTSLGNQNGTILLVAIGFLFILSILTLIINRSSLSEIMSSSSYRKSQYSFYAAERGVQKGLEWLSKMTVAPENSAGMPAWFYPDPVTAPTTFSNYSTIDGFQYSYAVEHVKDDIPPSATTSSAKIGTSTSSGPVMHYYRITGKGSDGAGTTVRKVQVVTTADF